MRLRPRSLFWTFTGSFLVVMIVAAVVQVVVLFFFLSATFREFFSGEARALATEISSTIAALDEVPSDDDIALILRIRRPDSERLFVVFQWSHGRIVTGEPTPRRMMRRIERAVRDDREDGGPDVGAPEPGEDGPPPLDAPIDRRRGPSLQVVARSEAIYGTQSLGEVVALAPRPPVPVLPPGAPLGIVVFLPLALILAAGAALLLFRPLVRRLRRLEALALQVASGDMEARVDDPGHDEIGRLGAQLNLMTERLAAARDRIDAADRTRRQLLADVSHELGTPLTSIRGYTETVLNPDIHLEDEERRQYLENVLEEARRIDLLVQDLFDLTRLEAGAGELVFERIDLADLARRTMERYDARLRDAGITSHVDAATAWVDADGRRLEQVFDNLVTNAIRYVPGGGNLWVRVVAGNPGGDPHRVVFEDDGPGFGVEDIDRVFDRFYRADNARATEGSGLGLAIVREIVERHGGTVNARHREPTGAVLTVELPPAPDATH